MTTAPADTAVAPAGTLEVVAPASTVAGEEPGALQAGLDAGALLAGGDLGALVGGVDLALGLAVLLMAVGVVGSVVPGVPGALLSLIGVYGYWWSTGFGEPGLAFVAVATLVGLTAAVVDLLAGAVSARVGGASMLTTAVAAVVGIVLFFVFGPLGTIAGVAGTVFTVEVYRGAEMEDGARTAVVTVVGLLASNVVQVLLTGAILVGFLLTVAL